MQTNRGRQHTQPWSRRPGSTRASARPVRPSDSRRPPHRHPVDSRRPSSRVPSRTTDCVRLWRAARLFADVRTIQIADHRYIAERLKTKKARAMVNRETGALKQALNSARKQGRLTRVPYIPMLREDRTTKLSEFVFHRDGEQVVEFRKPWKEACLSAKIGHRLFHDLRRTAVRNNGPSWRAAGHRYEHRRTQCDARQVRFPPRQAPANRDQLTTDLRGWPFQ